MGFKKFLFLEANRIFCIRKALILLLFYLFSIYFIQSGISQYKENLREKEPFQEYEKIRVETYNITLNTVRMVLDCFSFLGR